MTRNAIGYISIYAGKSLDEDLPIMLQQEQIEEYAEKNKFDLIEILFDKDISGKDFERDGFQKVLAFVEDGCVDGVLVYRFDRLVLETMDFLQWVGNLFHTYSDTKLISITEKIEFNGGYTGYDPVITVDQTKSGYEERKAKVEDLMVVFDSEVMGEHGPFNCPICGKINRKRDQFRGGGGTDYYTELRCCLNCGY